MQRLAERVEREDWTALQQALASAQAAGPRFFERATAVRPSPLRGSPQRCLRRGRSHHRRARARRGGCGSPGQRGQSDPALARCRQQSQGATCPAGKASRCGQLAVQPVALLKAQQLLKARLNAPLRFGFGCCVGRWFKLKPALGAGEHAGDHRCLACRSAAIALLADGDEQ